MTTIAYRNGVMAADTRAWGFDKAPIGSKQKPQRLADGSLLGVSTAVLGMSRAVREWVEGGMNRANPPFPINTDKIDFQAILVKPDGTCIMIDGNWTPSDPVKADYYAVGSGAHFALAALLLGQSAEEAVVTASKLDAWTGPEVVAVKHGEPA